MPAPLAIDIVLLPPQEVMNEIIQLNKLVSQEKQLMQLNTNDCLPHISLFMLPISENTLPTASGLLQKIADSYLPLELTADKITSTKRTSAVNIQKNQRLQELQNEVAKQLTPLRLNQVTASMFSDPSSEIEETEVAWVQEFPIQASGDNYRPHITIGPPTATVSLENSLNFTCDRIALSHLGTYCTCRKILMEFNIKN